jgi:selenocysteine lyase/cysteine desulfurase
VEIDLTPDGLIDLDDLVARLSDPSYAGRRKIGAFSAASNVSGVKTPVYEVARILHEHDALAFFDFAAIAPYVTIDVHRDERSYFDAIYFSPHKFLGGPGSSGVLLIHEALYRRDLPPTVGAGGTVNFVDSTGQDYSDDIEVREKPGTPGILQIMRASLAMELLERMDPERISVREDELLGRAVRRLDHPAIEILGPRDPAQRIAIISFNIREEQSYLHPRFVTLLLNDLFGIQSRAGCSCAGPYGHRMLHLDEVKSAALRERIHRGVLGLRPGWVRVNFHFLMTNEEADFLVDAIRFVVEHGRYFLPLYSFDVRTGAWSFKRAQADDQPQVPFGLGFGFGLDEALALSGLPTQAGAAPGESASVLHRPFPDDSSIERRRGYLDEALHRAQALRDAYPSLRLRSTLKDLIPFVYSA